MAALSPASVIPDLQDAASIQRQLVALQRRVQELECDRRELQTLKDKRYYKHEDGLVEQISGSERKEIEMRARIMDHGFLIQSTLEDIDRLKNRLFLLAKDRAARAGVVLEAPP